MGCVLSAIKRFTINIAIFIFRLYLRNKKIILCFHDPHCNGLSTGDLDDTLAMVIAQYYLTRQNTNTFIFFVICDDPTGTRYSGLKGSNKLYNNTLNSIVVKESVLKYFLPIIKKACCIICAPITTESATIIKGITGRKYIQGEKGTYNTSNSAPDAQKIIADMTDNDQLIVATSEQTGQSYGLQQLSLEAKCSPIHQQWMLFCLLKLFLLLKPTIPYALGLLLDKTIHPLGGRGNTGKEIASLYKTLGLKIDDFELDLENPIVKAYYNYLTIAIDTKLGANKTEEEFNNLWQLIVPTINMLIQIINILFTDPQKTLINPDNTIKTIGQVKINDIKVINPLLESGKAFDAILMFVALRYELYPDQYQPTFVFKEILKNSEYKENFMELFTGILNDALIIQNRSCYFYR